MVSSPIVTPAATMTNTAMAASAHRLTAVAVIQPDRNVAPRSELTALIDTGIGCYATAVPGLAAAPHRSGSQIIHGQFACWYLSSSCARSFTVSAGDQYPLYG